MASLSSELRRQLGNAVKSARREAEKGALKSLRALAVDRHEPFGSMGVEERALRNRLRARGRQVGDVRDRTKGTQRIDRLAHEVAYEYWHRMLFGQFLAENGLLIEPDSGVAITMAECADLAQEIGEDPHAMAARFAQSALPQIFRTGDPALDVTLTPETRQALERLIDGLPRAVFTADDSLGWTYQYWQMEKKDAVNEAGNAIGADDLPAVTQLFTERYMVLFLYHNTIGAWYAGKVLAENPEIADTARSEEDLRQNVRLRSHGGYDFEYLRFVRERKEGDEDAPTGPWHPAAGIFEGWPKTAKELKVLDPCCGSGHFLVEGFELLVRLRMDEEKLDLEDAIRSVLATNLHGLELDPRCTQIAAFHLAMAAWKLAGKPIELPALHIACSGLAVGSNKIDWVNLAGDGHRLRNGMERLYDLFVQAPELGSLIDPKELKGNFLLANFEELQPLLEQVLTRESGDVENTERAVAAQGMARAAELLSDEYALVITNVPYLGRGKQGELLKEFADAHYGEAKADLATIFVDRMLRWLSGNGTVAAVTPQNWLSLISYRKLREKLLKAETWHLLARLGPGAFETVSGEVVKVILLTLSRGNPAHHLGGLFSEVTVAGKMYGLDASESRTASAKAAQLRETEVKGVEQARQLENPDARITSEEASDSPILDSFAGCFAGVLNGDSPHFQKRFWEVVNRSHLWTLQQTTVDERCIFGGLEMILYYDKKNGHLREDAKVRREKLHDSDQRGNKAWGRWGVGISQMRVLPCALYVGETFDSNVAVMCPNDQSFVLPIWMYCRSEEYHDNVRRIDQKLNITNSTLAKVPFDLDRWTGVARERYPNGLPRPYSNDPTQWIFHGHPCGSVVWDEVEKWTAHGPLRTDDTVLQVAVARLLGYRWPAELDAGMELADEQREWVRHCETLHAFADKDGIVCIPPVRGEPPARERLLQLLASAFGDAWNNDVLTKLLAEAGSPSLDGWLRNRFFEQHCKLFHHRPFVWHIWDGNKNGFQCLVNAHKLTGPDGEGRRTLETITYSYLVGWIDRQREDQKEGKEGSDGRLAAALELQDQLEKILAGEPPFDLFIRWKPLHEQPLRWNPDINDGVRLNIRPFMKAERRKGDKKGGVGILRWKPNIKWAKDRGKEPISLRPKANFPWFWNSSGDGTMDKRTDFTGGSAFDGNRWNDLHYTNERKKTAREQKDSGGRE